MESEEGEELELELLLSRSGPVIPPGCGAAGTCSLPAGVPGGGKRLSEGLRA